MEDNDYIREERGDLYVDRSFIRRGSKVMDITLAHFIDDHPEIIMSDGRVPVLRLIHYLFSELRSLKKFLDADEEQKKLSIETKREKLQETRIKNQEKLRRLIHRSTARDRMLTLLQAVVNQVKYSIKIASPQLVMQPDARVIENILIVAYNSAIGMLERNADLIRWEDDGVEVKLGRTEGTENLTEGAGDRGSEEDPTLSKEQLSDGDRPGTDSVFDSTTESDWELESEVDYNNSPDTVGQDSVSSVLDS